MAVSRGFATTALCVLLAFLPMKTWAQSKSIVIASGGTTGVYYPVAVAICRVFNLQHSFLGYGCKVESTGGSVENLKKLRTGEVDFAIVQSDWLAHSRKGTDVFVDLGPHEELRSVFSLYTESFTVVARKDAGIATFEGLRGKRVNIGNKGSGQRATMEALMQAMGWTRFDFSAVREFTSELQALALCDREVDAIVFMAGHPSGSIKTATQTCDTNIVNIVGDNIERFVEENEQYRMAKIPEKTYFGQPYAINTFGVSALMVTTSNEASESVTRLLASAFEDLDKLKRMHPALAHLTKADMKKDIMPAPLHDAASDYYSSLSN